MTSGATEIGGTERGPDVGSAHGESQTPEVDVDSVATKLRVECWSEEL